MKKSGGYTGQRNSLQSGARLPRPWHGFRSLAAAWANNAADFGRVAATGPGVWTGAQLFLLPSPGVAEGECEPPGLLLAKDRRGVPPGSLKVPAATEGDVQVDAFGTYSHCPPSRQFQLRGEIVIPVWRWGNWR